MAPALVTSCTTLLTEGALRLRLGKAGSLALAGEEKDSMLLTSCTALPLDGADFSVLNAIS